MKKTNQTLYAIALGACVLFSTSCSTTKKSKVAPAAATETPKDDAKDYAETQNNHGNVDELISQMQLQPGMNIIVADNGSGFFINELRRRGFARISQNIIIAPGANNSNQGSTNVQKSVGPVINMTQRGQVDVVILDMVLNYADQRPLMQTSKDVLRQGNGKVYVVESKVKRGGEGKPNQLIVEPEAISALGMGLELNPFLRYTEHEKVNLVGFTNGQR